jgi:sarcosine oxidase gamma subunit
MLTRSGRAAVVVVDPEEWALASAALEAAEDAAAVVEFDQAVSEWDGTSVSHAQMLADLEGDEAAGHRRAG